MSTWIVTGASRGLGRQLTLQLAQRGARVLACARDEAALARLAIGATGPGEIRPVSIDLADPRSIGVRLRAAMAGERDLAGVINNAGIGLYKPFVEHDEAEFLQILQVNLGAVMQVCHAVLPRLLKQGRGHVINVGSDLGRRPLANMAAYVASKHGLAGFTHSLLREVKAHGVRVTLVNPGLIDTGFNGGTEDSGDGHGSLAPAALAALVLQVIDQPPGIVVDELTVHPLGQSDF
jgi:short-subunit dehydrogenase